MTEDVKELQALVIVLLKKVEELTQEVTELKARLAKYETPKNVLSPHLKMKIVPNEETYVSEVGSSLEDKKEEKAIR